MFELSQQGGEQVTGLDMATSTLLDDFQVVLAQDPAVLPGSLALARARALLRLGEQVLAVTAVAVRDVELRELFVLDDTGSTRSWLRTQPAGEGRHATLARQLAAPTGAGRGPVREHLGGDPAARCASNSTGSPTRWARTRSSGCSCTPCPSC